MAVDIKAAVPRKDTALALAARPKGAVLVVAALWRGAAEVIDTLKAWATVEALSTSAREAEAIDTERGGGAVDVSATLKARETDVRLTREPRWAGSLIVALCGRLTAIKDTELTLKTVAVSDAIGAKDTSASITDELGWAVLWEAALRAGEAAPSSALLAL